MKDFSHFGVKSRIFPEYNYHALWYNLKTIRLGTGVAKDVTDYLGTAYKKSNNEDGGYSEEEVDVYSKPHREDITGIVTHWMSIPPIEKGGEK